MRPATMAAMVGTNARLVDDETAAIASRRGTRGDVSNDVGFGGGVTTMPSHSSSSSLRESHHATHGGAPDRSSALTTPSPEATWQYLGDLPYRRVPIYSNVRWSSRPVPSSETPNATTTTASTSLPPNQSNKNTTIYSHGLAHYPPAALTRHAKIVDRREVQNLLQSTTRTLVAACPHGGPLAAVTIPTTTTASSSSSSSTTFTTTTVRIMTNAGQALATIPFPPPTSHSASASSIHSPSAYSPADIVTIGFTRRAILLIILRDGLLLSYHVHGGPALPPFYVLSPPTASEASTSPSGAVVVQSATVFEGGAAMVTTQQQAALVEFLDDHDDPSYASTCHATACRRVPDPTTVVPSTTPIPGPRAASARVVTAAAPGQPLPYALVTNLSSVTTAYTTQNYNSLVAVAVLPRHRTTSGHPEVFVSTSDRSVIVVEASTLQLLDVDCRSRIFSPILHLTFAPNGRFLACFTEQGMLTVISTSFETKVLDFDTSEGSTVPPLDMQWCGEDSVVLHWKHLGVLMVGPYGDWLRFPYETAQQLYLLHEMDGCRVVTDATVELLQRVPPATAQLLRIGSIDTAAMLLDAADAFHAGEPSSDETIRTIVQSAAAAASNNEGRSRDSDENHDAAAPVDPLLEAIECCTEAATREFDIVTQKRLLRAASYGMHYTYKSARDAHVAVMGGDSMASDASTGPWQYFPSPVATEFVKASQKLRILNALRNPKVGLLLTSAQFDAITPTGVIARLIVMQRPAMAVATAKYLDLPPAVQLYARAAKAAALVSRAPSLSDTELAEEIVRIINDEENLPKSAHGAGNAPINQQASSLHRGAFATVALAATDAGRPGVANLLLMLETSVMDKVPALIANGLYADAIAVATNARDAEFIFSTLMEYERHCLSLPDLDTPSAQAMFMSTVVSKFTPEAFQTLRRYLATTIDGKSVTNLLLRAQRYTDAGTIVAQRALAHGDAREKQGMLLEATRIFGLSKETSFQKTCSEEVVDLFKDQEVLRTKYGSYDVAPESTSVAQTISSVLRFAAVHVREQHRLLGDAEKIAKKFRLPEKRFWFIRVKAFAESEQWSNLRILADSRKSPIGYKPFARAALRGGQHVNEVTRYIERITVPEEKYELFCETKQWSRALEEASKIKDSRRIINVKNLCNSPEIQLLADQTLARIA